MKLCWSHIDGIVLNRKGNFVKGNTCVVLRESCDECGEPFFMHKHSPSRFCSKSCCRKGKRNTFYGKKHNEKSKLRISKHCPERSGVKNPNFRGGYFSDGVALFDTYKDSLDWIEDIRRDPTDIVVLQVRCKYCNKWFVPNRKDVYSRIKSAKTNRGECLLYCSENCKMACPIYRMRKFPKGFKKNTSREVQPELRKLVLERDNWTCQKCGAIEVELHCHHFEGIIVNPIESADVDMCITFCKKCHNKVHKEMGCRSVDLRCNRGESRWEI